MAEKVTSSRKSVVRRILVGAGIVGAVGAGAGLLAMVITGAPVVLVGAGAAVAISAGVAVVAGVVAVSSKMFSGMRKSFHKGRAKRMMNKIKAAERNTKKEMTPRRSAKLKKYATKFAKSNLLLSEKNGASIFGSLQGRPSGRGNNPTRSLNMNDSLNALEGTTGKGKYAHRSARIVRSGTIASRPENAWTQTYNVQGTNILDRRTEISALSPETIELFKVLAQAHKTDIAAKRTANVESFYTELKFGLGTDEYGKATSVASSYANVESQSMRVDALKIMLNDVQRAIAEGTYSAEQVFPMEVRTGVMRTKHGNSQIYRKQDGYKLIRNETELVNYLTETLSKLPKVEDRSASI